MSDGREEREEQEKRREWEREKRRPDDDRRVVGEAGEQLGGVAQHSLELAVRSFEEHLDALFVLGVEHADAL